jgi:ubiquitin carboxyl-terminal hydrolase 34
MLVAVSFVFHACSYEDCCMFQSFNTLHVMYHEATACHVTGDIIDLLTLLQQCLKVARETRERDKRGWFGFSETLNILKNLCT